MSQTKRKSAKREAEVNTLLKAYSGSITKDAISEYAKLAARVLKEGMVPLRSENNVRFWELYHDYERDLNVNANIEEREDTDYYGLTEDGRVIHTSIREIYYRTPNPRPYNFQGYNRFDRGTEDRVPSEFDLIQIDLLLEESGLCGVLEAFLKGDGSNYHVAKDNPALLERIQKQKEADEAERRRKREQNNQKAKKAGKTLLLVAAWILFWYFIFCFGREMITDRESMIAHGSQYVLYGSMTVGLLNFAQALRSDRKKAMLLFTIIASVILSFVFAGAVFYFGTLAQAYYWQQYLMLILRFIVAIVIGRIIGSLIRKKANGR